MPDQNIPIVSKSKINKAGKILVTPGEYTVTEANDSFNVINAWRARHAYPINTFQATLRDKVRHTYPNALVAQRLKRMPTIIDKLQRHSGMQLARMQDIGGVRVVLPDTKSVYRLAKSYTEGKFSHILKDCDDYINAPRDRDGYRSYHLIYRYNTVRLPGSQYNGLHVELQIRTRLQHAWATAVETMGTILGQQLKSGIGDQQWLDFFAVVSSAFAHRENSPPVPRFDGLSAKETYVAVARAEEALGVLSRMERYSYVANRITTKEDKAKWAYHIITLDSENESMELRSFGRKDLRLATDTYARLERAAEEQGRKIESVLVSAGPLSQLRQAYPNFFLDVTEFIKQVRTIIKKSNEE